MNWYFICSTSKNAIYETIELPEVKSSFCSCKVPRFSSYHQHICSELSLSTNSWRPQNFLSFQWAPVLRGSLYSLIQGHTYIYFKNKQRIPYKNFWFYITQLIDLSTLKNKLIAWQAFQQITPHLRDVIILLILLSE